ncbi:MAG: ATP-binding protein [Planctomycetota bacterium]
MQLKDYQESETVELKKSTAELKEAVISISAILNKHQKGEVYFGIKNDGTVVGQIVGKETLRDISQSIADNIEPKIFPKITTEKIQGKTCIAVRFTGSEIPYFAYGRAYIRVGDEDRKLSAKELENLIIRKNKDKLRWDTQVCKEAKLTDISSAKLKSFLKIAGLRYDNPNNALTKLKLITDGKLLNAAVILFGKKPQTFFPNARLRCAVFGTTDTSFTIDMQDFEGDLFYLVEQAQEYILKNIHIGMKLDGLRRVDVPEIDKEAFREAIINAFCHRDYYEYDSVNIAVFKDRVEIRNPGLLYGGLTIEQIKHEMISERRNELIAELFHRVHFIEKWGRGIKLILSKEPETDFKEVGRHFITVFKRKVKVAGKLGKKFEGINEGINEGLNEGLKSLLAIIRQKPGIKAKDTLVLLNNRPIKTIERQVKALIQKSLIERKGSKKTGGYYIIEE